MSTPAAREAGKTTRWPGRKRLEMEWALPDMAEWAILIPVEITFLSAFFTRPWERSGEGPPDVFHYLQNITQCSALRRCSINSHWMNEWVSESSVNQYLTLPFPCLYHQEPLYRQLFIHIQIKLRLTTNKPIMQIIMQTSPSSSNKPWYLWPLDILFSLPRTFFLQLPTSPNPPSYGQFLLTL